MNNAKQIAAQTAQNSTSGLSGSAGDAQKQIINPRPDGFELELIDAFQRELGSVRSELYALQNRVRRYDRAFETMFKEELDRRVIGKDSGNDCGAMEIGPLERLKYQTSTAQVRRGL